MNTLGDQSVPATMVEITPLPKDLMHGNHAGSLPMPSIELTDDAKIRVTKSMRNVLHPHTSSLTGSSGATARISTVAERYRYALQESPLPLSDLELDIIQRSCSEMKDSTFSESTPTALRYVFGVNAHLHAAVSYPDMKDSIKSKIEKLKGWDLIRVIEEIERRRFPHQKQYV